MSKIYSSCEEAYRLTESGKLDVPSEYVDPYCNGPCLTETHLVLNCIENIMTNFVFYNRATIQDIRVTIKAGCGYGPERGCLLAYEDMILHWLSPKCHNLMSYVQVILTWLSTFKLKETLHTRQQTRFCLESAS